MIYNYFVNFQDIFLESRLWSWTTLWRKLSFVAMYHLPNTARKHSAATQISVQNILLRREFARASRGNPWAVLLLA